MILKITRNSFFIGEIVEEYSSGWCLCKDEANYLFYAYKDELVNIKNLKEVYATVLNREIM